MWVQSVCFVLCILACLNVIMSSIIDKDIQVTTDSHRDFTQRPRDPRRRATCLRQEGCGNAQGSTARKLTDPEHLRSPTPKQGLSMSRGQSVQLGRMPLLRLKQCRVKPTAPKLLPQPNTLPRPLRSIRGSRAANTAHTDLLGGSPFVPAQAISAKSIPGSHLCMPRRFHRS